VGGTRRDGLRRETLTITRLVDIEHTTASTYQAAARCRGQSSSRERGRQRDSVRFRKSPI